MCHYLSESPQRSQTATACADWQKGVGSALASFRAEQRSQRGQTWQKKILNKRNLKSLILAVTYAAYF